MKKKCRVAAFLSMGVLLLKAHPAEAADFNGDGTDDASYFRAGSGLWSIRNLSKIYFGQGGDIPIPIDLRGNGTDQPAYFRPASGLWALRNITRIYYGGEGDVPLGKGGYNPYTSQYDYVVRPGDGDDLVAALESDVYRSVFIPAGTYAVSTVINVDHVRQISGEEMHGTTISFAAGSSAYLSIEINYCHLDKIRLLGGGSDSPSAGSLYVDADYATVRECRSDDSEGKAFEYTADAGYASFIDCIASGAYTGFRGADNNTSRLVNCSARCCSTYGFYGCRNLSNCWVDGYALTSYGFASCHRIASSMAFGCTNTGFLSCYRISSCEVNGDSHTFFGFSLCSNVSSCHVENVTGIAWSSCTYVDTGSCN